MPNEGIYEESNAMAAHETRDRRSIDRTEPPPEQSQSFFTIIRTVQAIYIFEGRYLQY